MKLKQLTKIGILIFGISIFFTACEKESTDEIITQEKFDAPSIELAKQFVNSKSNTSSPNLSLKSSSSYLTSVTHWEGSKTKKYKKTEKQNVDILYTPIYVKSTRTDIKGFIASTEQNGIVDSRKFYVLYKSNDLSNGLNAYILIYGLDGNLQQAYNYENGQSIPLPETSNNGDALNKSESECDKDMSTMNDEEFEIWWSNCTGIPLDEVVVTAPLAPDGPNIGGGTSAFNDWNSNQWVGVHIPAVTDPSSNYNSGNTTGNNTAWHTPNVTVANAPSIAAVLDAAFNSIIANWLREMEQTNQQILNQIAAYLNANREENPFSDFNFENMQPEQFPVSDEAINTVNNFINNSIDASNNIQFHSSVPDCLESIIIDLMLGDFTDSIEDMDSMGNIDLIDEVFSTLGVGNPGTDMNFKFIYTVANIAGNGNTSPLTYNSTTGTYSCIIIIDEDLVNNGTKLAIVKTVLHESIHAYLKNIAKEYPAYFIDPNGTFSTLITAWQNYNNNNDAQHVYMASIITNMANNISNFVQEKYYYPNANIDYYEAVCWSGLTHLTNGNLNPLFSNNYPNTTDQKNIIKIFNTENGTETYPGYTPLINNNCN